MLANKANTKFFPPVKVAGDGGDTRTAQFYFEHEGKPKMCEISILVAAVLGQTEDELQEALVQEINDRLCREFPYEQLIELKALAPRMSAEEALAGTVASAANDLVVQGAVPETWPLVCDEFVKIFSPAVSRNVMQEVVRFFQPVVNKFTKRAYDTGWAEGNKKLNHGMYETWFMGVKVESSIPPELMGKILASCSSVEGFMQWWEKQLKSEKPL